MFNYMKWILLIVFHMWVVLGNAAAFFVVPFLAPWYVSLPICSFIFLISFSKQIKCPLTEWENNIRMKMGKKKIGGFVGHYLLRPIKRFLTLNS